MGLNAGMAAFLIVAAISVIGGLGAHFVAHHSVLADVRAQVVQMMKSNPNPQSAQVMQVINTDGGLIAMIAMGTVMLLVMFLVLSAVGGAIQARILKSTGAR
jgi:hypothetical protein